MRKFLVLGLTLLSTSAFSQSRPYLDNSSSVLEFSGNVRIGIQYALEPPQSSGSHNKEGFTVVSDMSDLLILAKQKIAPNQIVYGVYDIAIDPAEGTILSDTLYNSTNSNSPLFSPYYLYYIGYRNGNFDTKIGTVYSIPYQYVGIVNDIGYGVSGMTAFTANDLTPRTFLTTYDWKNFQFGFNVQMTGSLNDLLSGGVGNNISIYSTAFGLKYENEVFRLGLATNYISEDADNTFNNDGYSPQSYAYNSSGVRPQYFGASVVLKSPSVNPYEIFGTLNYLTRKQSTEGYATGKQYLGADGNLYSDPDSFSGDTGRFQDISCSIGMRYGGWQFQFENGVTDRHTTAITINHSYPITSHINLRSEAYFPGSLINLNNAAGLGYQSTSTDTYRVDLEYNF